MKRILVTGATSGIGRAMAVTLHRAGHRVLAIGRNRAALSALTVEAEGIETLALDLVEAEEVAAALSGRAFDVLVNNAGTIPRPRPFDAMERAEIDRTVLVNLQSVLWLTRLVVPGMRAQGSGHVIFTGSSAGHAPGANFAVYAATKAAVAAFAAALRAELSADGIRVTEIAPGRVETALYADVLDEAERQAMYRGSASLQPEDVAEALLAVLNLPARADVTRLDIMPTRPVPAIKLDTRVS
ncbi:MAG: SDR family NAD(P)-dependent oxidoreductase [Gemmobacter sp.]|nr:SDR family NAD(P)-dependent oxidoreductase [Gemmobacter sp.]